MRHSLTILGFAYVVLAGYALAAPVTFNQQIAPIVYRNCSP